MLPVLGTTTTLCSSQPSSASPSSLPASLPPSLSPCAPSSPASTSLAQLAACAPQPYGSIPRPRKRQQRSSRQAAIPLSSTTSCLSSRDHSHSDSSNDAEEVMDDLDARQPWLNALQALFVPEKLPTLSPPSWPQPGFWAALKEQYLNNPAWSSPRFSLRSSSSSSSNTLKKKSSHRRLAKRSSSSGATASPRREFLPPSALFVAHNSSPVVRLNKKASSGLQREETEPAPVAMATLLLPYPPNLDMSGSGGPLEEGNSTPYPVAKAAMDRFKGLRSDTIPLTTFTYSETPIVVEVGPKPMPLTSLSRAARPSKATGDKKALESQQKANETTTDEVAASDVTEALPRHLTCRDTRSNPDYLRMMAPELRMIRARKLIAPLKPRGYLSRRRDLFRHVKSPLSTVFNAGDQVDDEDEAEDSEEDHPLSNLTVGSWTSTLSSDSFLSANSDEYHTADENDD